MNVLFSPSFPEELYLMYSVSNPSSDSDWVSLFTTVALTPEISPSISIFPSTNFCVYCDTGTPRKFGSIRIQK